MILARAVMSLRTHSPRVPAVTFIIFLVTSCGLTQAQRVSTLARSNFPRSVAVDGQGDVFVADFDNTVVYELLAVDGSIPANPTVIDITPLPLNAYSPLGVAVNKSGVVYFSGGVAGPYGAPSRTYLRSPMER